MVQLNASATKHRMSYNISPANPLTSPFDTRWPESAELYRKWIRMCLAGDRCGVIALLDENRSFLDEDQIAERFHTFEDWDAAWRNLVWWKETHDGPVYGCPNLLVLIQEMERSLGGIE